MCETCYVSQNKCRIMTFDLLLEGGVKERKWVGSGILGSPSHVMSHLCPSKHSMWDLSIDQLQTVAGKNKVTWYEPRGVLEQCPSLLSWFQPKPGGFSRVTPHLREHIFAKLFISLASGYLQPTHCVCMWPWLRLGGRLPLSSILIFTQLTRDLINHYRNALDPTSTSTYDCISLKALKIQHCCNLPKDVPQVSHLLDCTADKIANTGNVPACNTDKLRDSHFRQISAFVEKREPRETPWFLVFPLVKYYSQRYTQVVEQLLEDDAVASVVSRT